MSKLSGCSVEEDLSGCDNGSIADWEKERTLWALVGFGAPQTLEGHLRRVLKDFSLLWKGGAGRVSLESPQMRQAL